jgi:hypothetical protein
MATQIRKPLVATGTVLLALVLAGALVLPGIAHAAQSESGVRFLDEGWWLRFREPLAPVPAGGGVGLPSDTTEIPRATVRDQTNPYRGEYTRVSALPGEDSDEAVAAYGFDLFGLGGGASEAKITGGSVRFVAAPRESAPQAGDGANAQRNEEAAKMVGCLVTEFFAPDFAGNWEARPPVDCSTSSPLELASETVEGRPVWTMDLAPFASAWGSENFGFAVVPDPEATGPDAVFHVAFPTALNNNIDLEVFPPPTADVTFEVDELSIPDIGGGIGGGTGGSGGFEPVGGTAGSPSFDSGGGGGFGGSSGGGFDSGSSGGFGGSSGSFGGSGDVPVAADGTGGEADMPETADEEELFSDEAVAEDAGAEAPLAAPGEESGGGPNLGLLLVPLLGLGLAGTLGYSLSKDPELPLEREGAVSKLMQRRTSGALARPDTAA